MSEIVVDWIYIKMIQTIIKRKLTREEMEQVECGETLFLQKPNGVWISFDVPLYKFPYDLMPKETDAQAIEEKNQNASIFDYALNVGPILKVQHG